MEFSTIAKWIIFIGIGIVLLGLILWGASKIGLPIGKLPGDIHIQRQKFTLYVPLVTSLILSLFFTIIINLIFWLFRK